MNRRALKYAWIRRILGMALVCFGLGLGFFMVRKHYPPEFAALMATGNIMFGVVIFVTGFFDIGVKPSAKAKLIEFPAVNKEILEREQNG